MGKGIKKLINIVFRNVLKIQISKYSKERQAILEAKKLFGDKPIVACEIGVFKADHVVSMFENLNIKKIYLIDPYEKYTEYSEDEWCKDVYDAKTIAHRLLRKYKDKIVWIEKYSDEALLDIKDKLDFLYIDGNHYHPYVDNDIKNYSKLVKDGGIISGHDYDNAWIDVIRAVNKFSESTNKKVSFGYGTDWIIFK